jgi:hypothetical protein
MISTYIVIPLVFGLVLSYLGLIHRFWLCAGIERVSQLLAYVREHPVIPAAVASKPTSAVRTAPDAKRTAIPQL